MLARHICIFLLSIACLSGCHTGQTEQTETADNRNLIMSHNLDQLIGTQWTLEAIIIDGTEYPLSETRPFIKFENDQRISGFASVNRFFGSIRFDDDGGVKWPAPLGSTRMAGPPERMNQETAFLSALQQTDSFSLEEMTLHAQTPNPDTKLIFVGSVN